MSPHGSAEIAQPVASAGSQRVWLAWLREHGLTLALGAGIFVLAYEGGAYALGTRAPVAMGLWTALAIGVAVGFLPRARPGRAAVALAVMFACFAGLQGLSALWADSTEEALLELDRVALYLAVFGLVLLSAREGTGHRWADGLALGIVATGLVALSSRLFPDLFGPPDIDQVNPGDPRLSFPVNYWNGLSVLLALAMPLLLRAATEARTAVVAAAAVAPLPALVAAMYFTSSRGGAAAALVGIAAFVALTSRRVPALAAAATGLVGSAVAIAFLRTHDELVNGPVDADAVAGQGRASAVVIVLACVATGGAWAFARSRVPERVHVSRTVKRAAAAVALIVIATGVVAADPAQRFEDLKKPPELIEADYVQSHITSTSGNGRWQFWSAAVDQFENDPVLGGGAGSFEAWWAQHGTLDYFTRNAHSLFLETLGELGLVGLLLLIGLIGTGLVLGIRRVRAAAPEDRALPAALLASLVAFVLAAGTDWVWNVTVIGVIGVVCLALLAGRATSTTPRPAPRWAIGWRVVAVIAALVLVATEAVPWLTERRIEDSQSALKGGDAEQALDHARDARDIQPWAASGHLQVALVEEYTRDYAAAQESIERAIDRDPSDWQLWIVASRIDEARGDIPAARSDYERARALNPRSPYFDGSPPPGSGQ